jgi:F-type H+-transporting ATPase subunit b
MAETTEHAMTAGETHESTGAEHGSGGLPQFQFQHWGGQIAYLLVLFVILYLLISRVFTPRLRGVIDQRAATIAGALEAARQVQAEAASQAAAAQAELAEARARSHKLATDARSKAAADAAARQASEDARLGERMAEAEARIRASRDAAMAHVSGIAADTASAIVEKLTGKAAAASEISAAVAASKGAA